ncbi:MULTISPECIES: plasmid replication protein RepC [Agrobacterium]|uniref:Replication initiation protein RepC n=2 Tax=Agrobacterium tumefaciens complex TaxID=1183400 RepID=A0AAE6EHX8_AGRTU|nr:MULTISPECIES: plasmid replication protein RepC [Agrobacterium]ASK40740.1 replication initiation protein RepC [Agrobacterium genomosp. 6]ASK41503.1 replication initiation protein RepC [Agrobacterium genomosp. 6]QCL77467.1 replication initiation protein RepC [Agrobacterium tumefaciens]QCL82954.1 replication initiation protein RepC [Agrobacterium tumefaciens]CUX71695.1 putative replication protein C [Agrobacterium sp. NCPPB 925]
MQTHISTTPFGRRPMTLGHLASQMAARAVASDVIANKWQVFQHIRESRELIGATDRSLSILNALLTFHPEITLTGGAELVVWPSNEQLMARANGMPATTLRRHLAVLVDCGLIIRRDSPNGKRFARKGRGGEIKQAYGFDLSPIVARSEEFRDLAQEVQVEKTAFRVAKERLTLLRRDIVKMIDAGIDESVPGNWGRFSQTYQGIIGRLPRSASRQITESIALELEELCTEIRDVLELFTKSVILNANESHFGRHIQNSKPDSKFESEYGTRKEKEAGGSVAETKNGRSSPQRELPLGIVLDACPEMQELAQGGTIRHWRDLLATAELARSMLGISPSAWQEARETMGEQHAAITLASIYQRAAQINNAGGYLRSLTERAKDGKFSTWPMVMALLRAKLDDQRNAAGAGKPRTVEEVEDDSRLHVSESLHKNLSKPRSW